ncbi:hypothetical protein [Aequorivita capsosiphonis]|uniref:hypothetical protein n=1 Tax=Aequorivita capsosiphonis TaxID=487317 RepID=UPI00040466CA|nr:hypothetical protein [Aequorivita capsosiphonis]
MHKITFIIAFLFFGSYSAMAQKIIEKEFSAEGIHRLSIADDSIFSIKINSSKRESIKMKVHVSGEHAEAIIIEENRFQGKLALKTAVMPYFTFEKDKLAVHKVMAIEVEMYIPETISVEIKSKLASLETKGKIQNLSVSLQNGSCILTDFSGRARLKTITGNIELKAQKEVSGKAVSRNGTVVNTLFKEGKFLVEAESINGDIYMLQTN